MYTTSKGLLLCIDFEKDTDVYDQMCVGSCSNQIVDDEVVLTQCLLNVPWLYSKPRGINFTHVVLCFLISMGSSLSLQSRLVTPGIWFLVFTNLHTLRFRVSLPPRLSSFLIPDSHAIKSSSERLVQKANKKRQESKRAWAHVGGRW